MSQNIHGKKVIVKLNVFTVFILARGVSYKYYNNYNNVQINNNNTL